MDKIKFFSENLDVKNKTIILRLDLNVPLTEKKIQDTTRILINLPFLNSLIKKKAKVIIVSHLGRPNGEKNKEFSLVSVYKFLKEHLKTNIYFFVGDINDETKNKFSYLKEGEIILLENIEFFKEEIDNDDNFAKKLASLADIFINDAFSCSHRKQASIHKITKHIKDSYGGPLLKKEINAINSILKNKKEPVTCIIGGSKISTKINLIINIIKNVNNLIIVGAMANNFLTFKGVNVGKSLIEKNSSEIIDKIYSEAKKYNCNVLIPEDCNVSTDFKGNGIIKEINLISKNEIILDIGPKTIKKIKNLIDQSRTVLWNGPAGYFENKAFSTGTLAIAKKISENTENNSLISVLGGGDTISALNKSDRKFFYTLINSRWSVFRIS